MRPDSLWNTARVDTPERHACWYKSIQSDNQQQNRQWRMRCTVEFENIDLDAILQEIEASGLSVSQAGDGLSDTDIASYRELVAGAGESASALEDLNIVLLDRSTGAGTVLRNLAQTVKDDTGADTVMVRAPHNTQVLSDSLSRYQIESTQREPHGSRAPEDVPDFLLSAEQMQPDFGLLNVLILVGVLIVALCATAGAVITYRRPGR